MNAVKNFLNEIWNLIASYGFTEREILCVVLLLAALELFIRCVRAFRKRRQVDYSTLSGRIDHLSIKLADLESQLTRHLKEYPEEKKKLDETVRQRGGSRGSAADVETPNSEALRPRSPILGRPERAVPPAVPETPPRSSSPAVQVPETVPPVQVERAAPADIPPIVPPATGGGIFAGLKKTRDAFRSRLASVFSGGKGVTSETLDELEELLISSDLGVRASARLLEGLSIEAKARGQLSGEEAKEVLKTRVRALLGNDPESEINIKAFNTKPVVILVVGVNGVGKTTTIGKLARKFVDQGLKVTLAACDTFRAAAVEQIRVWGERSGVEVVYGGDNVKPTTVLYQAMEKAIARGDDVLIVDTAGRLHTRVNLMNELGSLVSMIERRCPGAPHEGLLVVDATTGQNALEQAREFGKKVKLTGLIVSKLDGTPKGGIVVAIKEELGIPIRYIGVGEGTEDLRVFDPSDFVDALFDDKPGVFRSEQKQAVSSGAELLH